MEGLGGSEETAVNSVVTVQPQADVVVLRAAKPPARRANGDEERSHRWGGGGWRTSCCRRSQGSTGNYHWRLGGVKAAACARREVAAGIKCGDGARAARRGGHAEQRPAAAAAAGPRSCRGRRQAAVRRERRHRPVATRCGVVDRDGRQQRLGVGQRQRTTGAGGGRRLPQAVRLRWRGVGA